jgi:hypothetical protein
MKNLSQYSWSPSRDLNLGPPEYEAGMLTSRLQRLCFFTVRQPDSHLQVYCILIPSKESQIIPWQYLCSTESE